MFPNKYCVKNAVSPQGYKSKNIDPAFYKIRKIMHIVILLAATAIVLAQQDCSSTNFEPCKNELQKFQDSTCVPLSAMNASFVTACQCYYSVNLA